MGLKGGLVRRVFSKGRSSTDVKDGNGRNFGLEKGRWSSVRLYLCGDECDTRAEDDFLSSIEGSEATVMQPIAEGSGSGDEESRQMTKAEEHDVLIHKEEEEEKEEEDPPNPHGRNNAAVLIQSAVRGFLARRRFQQMKQLSEEDQAGGLENLIGASVATSTEVQVGDSMGNLEAQEVMFSSQHRVLQKSRTQVFRVKEEWDDSTVSSNVSKLRVQSRLEATTRRERALAYAFSQQLRICTSKKRSAQSSSTESNMGWSWLERWMATRMPENSLVKDCLRKHTEPTFTDRTSVIIRKRYDVVEEKESCGSNDVSVNFDNFSTSSETPGDGHRPVKSRLKAAKNVTRRKKFPDYHYSTRPTKVSKRCSLREEEKEHRFKQVQSESTENINCLESYQQTSVI